MAKRGRGFLGFIHAFAMPGRWDEQYSTVWIDLLFVSQRYRNRGVGRKLLEEVKKEIENMGIKRVEFLSPGDQTAKWTKEMGAKVQQHLMGVDL